MRRHRGRRAVTAITAITALGTVALAGCGSRAAAGAAATGAAPPPSLALSLVSAAGTWATVEMGGSAADENNFWELFTRPRGTAGWRLVTPPGMASNGGLVLASAGGQSLVTAFRPSQLITFSPLASTADDGAQWTPVSPAAGLAGVPDALAAAGDGAGLLALTPGSVERSRPGGPGWVTLARQRWLAASAAGRACGLRELTAVAFGPAGVPMAGGACARAGTAGIFALDAGRWQAAGPALPAALAGKPVTVLRLAAEGSGDMALLSAGSGPAATVAVAWREGGPGRWLVSPGLRTGGRTVLSASFGPGGWAGLVLSGGQGEVLPGPDGTWRTLPALPAGTQVLAAGTAGRAEALAAHRSLLTVWRAGPGTAGWARQQVISVPIQYGSSS
jgi:hypothetical protein